MRKITFGVALTIAFAFSWSAAHAISISVRSGGFSAPRISPSISRPSMPAAPRVYRSPANPNAAYRPMTPTFVPMFLPLSSSSTTHSRVVELEQKIGTLEHQLRLQKYGVSAARVAAVQSRAYAFSEEKQQRSVFRWPKFWGIAFGFLLGVAAIIAIVVGIVGMANKPATSQLRYRTPASFRNTHMSTRGRPYDRFK